MLLSDNLSTFFGRHSPEIVIVLLSEMYVNQMLPFQITIFKSNYNWHPPNFHLPDWTVHSY